MRRLIKKHSDVDKVDARNLIYQTTETRTEEKDDWTWGELDPEYPPDYNMRKKVKLDGKYTVYTYLTECLFNSNSIGKLFWSYDFQPGMKDSYPNGTIVIHDNTVEDQYQGVGIGQRLYKQMAESMAEMNYTGAIIDRTYQNVIAEYAFRKAIAQGWFPDMYLDENLNHADRMYGETSVDWLNEEIDKFPEDKRGPKLKREDYE